MALLSTRDPISDGVRQFIERHIRSVEQLELLLLLRRSAGRSWTAEEASRELRTRPSSVAPRLAELAGAGLVACSDAAYAYPSPGPREDVLSELERAYARYRARVISIIFSTPAES